jgi:dihydrofolate synthase / folylpolyglutamate synthase
VTQFEAITAAAYSEMARQGVECAVIEAGLGGRYDATNVIPSSVQVLTSVGLEHTRWLGPTLTDIAREKLDVVQPDGTLVLGSGLAAEVLAVAEHVCGERGARIVHAGTDPGVPLVRAAGLYQRRNFALARAAAELYLAPARPLDPAAVAAAAEEVRVPGRLEQIDSDPLTVLDVAHNPEGMRALTESLPELAGGRAPVVAVVSVLDDKDAAGMLTELMPVCDRLVLTATQNPRVLPPATLKSLATQLAGPPAEVVGDPWRALARARELAGPDGLVVVTGSQYLIGDLLAGGRRERASSI